MSRFLNKFIMAAAWTMLALFAVDPAWAQGNVMWTTQSILKWQPGPGSEQYFRRIREGSPSSCGITHTYDSPNTVVMRLDCRNRPTGGKVVFESFRGRQITSDWQVIGITRSQTNNPRTRVEFLQTPSIGAADLTTRVRLVAERGRMVEAKISVPILGSYRGRTLDPPWCDFRNDGGFNCANDNDCRAGFVCSRGCGNKCAYRY